MGARSSSLVARSLRRSLRLCPSRRGPRAKAAEDGLGHGHGLGHPLGPLEALEALRPPAGAFVMPLENPPDVIGAHQRYHSHHQHQAAGRLCDPGPGPRRALAPIQMGQQGEREQRERTLPTQHLHPEAAAASTARHRTAVPRPCSLVSRADSAGHAHCHGLGGRRRTHHGHRARPGRTSSRPCRRPRDQRKCSSPATRSCFGYDIEDVDGFLAKASLDNPANIPMVLSCACTLYRTKEGGWQEEVPLPLGMVVNGVFRASCWLYAQTPHGHEGYVRYSSCLPLGILPQAPRTPISTSACWDTASDIFPYPSLRNGNSIGNPTDTRSEMAYGSSSSEQNRRRGRGAHLHQARRVERMVDALYLRAVTPTPKPRAPAAAAAGHARDDPHPRQNLVHAILAEDFCSAVGEGMPKLVSSFPPSYESLRSVENGIQLRA